MGKSKGKVVNTGERQTNGENKTKGEKAKKAKKSEVKKKKSTKVSKRALFELLFNYKDGNDLTKLMDRVVELVKNDPESVTRRFWACSIDCDDDPAYDIEGAPEDAEGYVSPVHLACSDGLHDALLYLLDHGGDPNDCWGIDCCQVTAAQAAVQSGHLNCVRLLHERGVDIGDSFCFNEGNMANCAVNSGNVELLKFLTSINVGPVDCQFKVSELMLAAIQENQASVEEE